MILAIPKPEHWLVPWSSKIVVLSWGKPTQPNGAYTTDHFFKYEENVLEIVKHWKLIIFKLKSNFPGITIQQKFDLFNKFILPILYYGVKVWGLNEGIQSCTFL